ncbi:MULTISPECIES: mycofactocin biosynthesis chaperone MftB [Streptomyces]|jgi:mycofactocin biosynthesis protein MftB|uniref:mycofactocin biosynthesis chaperone MftB n=1 Tax=Streptomyces TaxID=1883 RepID=UPI002FDBB6BD
MSAHSASPADGPFDLDGPWTLHPQVAVRPERFGGLLYHFGTRKLSFVKDPTLLAVVRSLADAPDARAACRAAGVADAVTPRYQRALAALAASRMITPRCSPLPGERTQAQETRR